MGFCKGVRLGGGESIVLFWEKIVSGLGLLRKIIGNIVCGDSWGCQWSFSSFLDGFGLKMNFSFHLKVWFDSEVFIFT